jgi:hypothetical protein
MNRTKSSAPKKSVKKSPAAKKAKVAVVKKVSKRPPVKPVLSAGWEPVLCGNSQPFSEGLRSITVDCSITSPSLRQVSTVPAGKRLVIEFVTADINVPTGQYVDLAIITRIGNASTGFRIQLDKVQNINGNDIYVTSQPVKLYTDENRNIEMYINRYPFTGTGHATVMCSGHIENMA